MTALKINKDTIHKPKEIVRFLNLYGGKQLPNDPWTIMLMSAYLRPMKSGGREYMILDYQGIEATFKIDKDTISGWLDGKKSWTAPNFTEGNINDDVAHFLANDLTEEHVIQSSRGFRFNYTKIALDVASKLKRTVTRNQLMQAKKPKASEIGLGLGSDRTQFIVEMFKELEFEKQQELLEELHILSQAPVELPDTLE